MLVQGIWVLSSRRLGEACVGLSGSQSKTHRDLHGVVGIDDPGHVGWTLQDEHGVGIPRPAAQIHLHSHCPGSAGRHHGVSAKREGGVGWVLTQTGYARARPEVLKSESSRRFYLEASGCAEYVEMGEAWAHWGGA